MTKVDKPSRMFRHLGCIGYILFHRENMKPYMKLIAFIFYCILYVFPILLVSLPVTLPSLLCKPRFKRRFDLREKTAAAPWKFFKRSKKVYDSKLGDKLHRRRWHKQIRRLEPTPLPAVRKRSISRGRRASQVRSTFLSKVPLEIRQMIYIDVIKDGSVHRHIVEVPNTKDSCHKHNPSPNLLCGVGCKGTAWRLCCDTHSNSDNPVDMCALDLDPFESTKEGKSFSPLALARVSRQVYLESIDLFYGK